MNSADDGTIAMIALISNEMKCAFEMVRHHSVSCSATVLLSVSCVACNIVTCVQDERVVVHECDGMKVFVCTYFMAFVVFGGVFVG